jgi:glycosyltransferase involved in cell wall biosynthesis
MERPGGIPMSYAVVMHVYNEEECLERVLDAIIEQTAEPIGLYIVDDDSIDGTEKIIKDYDIPYVRLRDYLKEPWKRRANAFNIAVNKAKALYPEAIHLLKVDGDTLIEDRYAEKLLPRMKRAVVAAVSGVSTIYRKTRGLNNGAVLYRIETLPEVKRCYAWDRQLQLDITRSGYIWSVVRDAEYTDLRMPHVMRPPLTRVIKNRMEQRTAAVEGWIRRHTQY